MSKYQLSLISYTNKMLTIFIDLLCLFQILVSDAYVRHLPVGLVRLRTFRLSTWVI